MGDRMDVSQNARGNGRRPDVLSVEWDVDLKVI
jgi:hypothetical protein